MIFIDNSKKLINSLTQLINSYDHIAFGVAWASSHHPVFETLLENKKKIAYGVIGIHFYQTDPVVIERLQKHKNVKFILQPNGTFHPKVYLFWNDENDWQAIIGSANLTNGAMTHNTELCVLMNHKDKKDFNKLQKIIYNYEGVNMSDEALEKYKNLWHSKKDNLAKLTASAGSSTTSTLLDSIIMSSTWADYYQQIQKGASEGFNIRINLLDEIQCLFSSKTHFNQLDENSRRIIAGIHVPGNDTNRWFGSMVGAGIFKNKIIENDRYISKALDCIPLTGEVTREDYLNFITHFKRAYPDGGDGPAITSRLASMKRPDYFICVNEANLDFISDDLSITKSKIKSGDLRYENYWDLIIDPILQSPWWNSPEPLDETEKSAWHKRVAMLDTISYQAI